MTKTKEDGFQISELSRAAWRVRDRASTYGPTKVGCALRSEGGNIYSGCNAEHRFRSHDIHAEVAAISAMVAGGEQHIETLLVVASREQFTPCGACMDWIMEFGGPSCTIGFQCSSDAEVRLFEADELMPHYPL